MIKKNSLRAICAATLAGVFLAGCSGSTEDVRVTLCKNLTQSLLPMAQSIEWTGNENTFKRPEFAITGLSFDVVNKDGGRSSGRSACHYAYETLDETAVTLANPLTAYANLPFAMTIDGRALSDAELLTLVNEEQKRLGRKVIGSMEQGARDMADRVRAGIGQ